MRKALAEEEGLAPVLAWVKALVIIDACPHRTIDVDEGGRLMLT